jgi:hypothetical protein
MRRLLVLGCLVVAVPLTGCTAVVAADFDVVAKPTECSLVAPQTADRHSFVRCDAASTCVVTAYGKAVCLAISVAGDEGAACTAVDVWTWPRVLAAALLRPRLRDGGRVRGRLRSFTDATPLASGREYGFCAPT